MISPPMGIFDPKVFTEHDLLRLKERAFELLREGKTIMSYDGEGTSAGRQFTMPIADMLLEIVWSLKSINPQKYGYLANRVRNWFY